jgi:hypothetical protein
MLIRGGKRSSLTITLTAFGYCCLNTYSIAEEMLAYHVYPKDDWLSLHFILGSLNLFRSACVIDYSARQGSIVFFTGFALNLQADSILRNLRKDNNERDYKIPRGNLIFFKSDSSFSIRRWSLRIRVGGEFPRRIH